MRHRLLGIVIGSRATAVAIISHYYCYRSPCPTLPLPFHLSSLFSRCPSADIATIRGVLERPMEITWVNLTLDLVSECAFVVLWFVLGPIPGHSGDYKILHDFFPWFVQHQRSPERLDPARARNFRSNWNVLWKRMLLCRITPEETTLASKNTLNLYIGTEYYTCRFMQLTNILLNSRRNKKIKFCCVTLSNWLPKLTSKSSKGKQIASYDHTYYLYVFRLEFCTFNIPMAVAMLCRWNQIILVFLFKNSIRKKWYICSVSRCW